MACTCTHEAADHDAAEQGLNRITAGGCKLCLCEAYTEPGSMRVMWHRRCESCKYDWKAPSDKGSCPQCRSSRVKTLGMQNNGLKRV